MSRATLDFNINMFKFNEIVSIDHINKLALNFLIIFDMFNMFKIREIILIN